MAAKVKSQGGPIADINVTPFVDIVLVLLVVLMVTAVQVVRAAIPVDLPSASSGKDIAPSTVNIVLDKKGALFLDGVPSSETQLATLVKRETKKNPKVQAVIAADKEVQYEQVVSIIDLIKTNGIKSFALNISKRESRERK